MRAVGVAAGMDASAWREVLSVATREAVASPHDPNGQAYVSVLDRRSSEKPRVMVNDRLRLVRVISVRTVSVPYENVRSIVEL